MKLGHYLTLVDHGEHHLAQAFEILVARHGSDAEIKEVATRLAGWSRDKRAAIAPALARYGTKLTRDPERLFSALFHQPRIGGLGLLRDFHDAAILVHHAYVAWDVVEKAAEALFDSELQQTAVLQRDVTERQARWLRTMIHSASAQALTVPAEPVSELRASIPAKPLRTLVQDAVRSRAALAVAAAGAFGMVLALRSWFRD